MSESGGGRITVGVDGSPASAAALRWAVDLARLRNAEIVAVCAWHVPLASLAPYSPVSRRPTQDGERGRAAAFLAGAMQTAWSLAPDVKVRAALVCGPPAHVIIDHCADTDLLVLGAHHAAAAPGRTMGAIAASCLRLARCPVVIVAAASPARAAPAADVAPAKPGPPAARPQADPVRPRP